MNSTPKCIDDYQIDGPPMAFFVVNGVEYTYKTFAIGAFLSAGKEKAIDRMMVCIRDQWNSQKWHKLEGDPAVNLYEDTESLIVWRQRPCFESGKVWCRVVFVPPGRVQEVRAALDEEEKKNED